MWRLYSFLFSIFLITNLISCGEGKKDENVDVIKDSVIIPEPVIEYGFVLDSFDVIRDTVQQGWTMSHMFSGYDISQYEINIAAERAADSTIGLKYIKEGKPFIILKPLNDTGNVIQYCIYSKNVVDYIVFDFTDSIYVERRQKPNDIKPGEISGEIVQNSNLSNALNQQYKDLDLTGEMAEKLAGTFAWSIDFFRLHANDHFKVFYDEKTVEGTPYGVGNINAAYFNHAGKDFYAFRFVLDSANNKVGYFNEEGKQMKKPFLMSPVKFSRISSGFTMKRFHPVQKRWKAHLGTDYAAPHGTPILATADGTVIAASYSKGNGNYVKIKHDDVYSTQYLHMSSFAKGISKGTYVMQGEVIGYVGSTGLATGPHVCYRFWKNGKQINHRTEQFEASEPMVDSLLPAFLEYIQPIKAKIDSLKITPYVTKEEMANDSLQ
ncbi:MAG: peptidoglycan DD-metalloendopeptidase family protein [Crocinitomicaceae bacterium]|nr:peptidoglycan DD-metalloendopeptidase family protein [Crocinitomicaceae bacterium]